MRLSSSAGRHNHSRINTNTTRGESVYIGHLCMQGKGTVFVGCVTMMSCSKQYLMESVIISGYA